MSEPQDSIVALARKILVKAVRTAADRSREDGSPYFSAANRIELAQPVQIDSWLALDAVIAVLALKSPGKGIPQEARSAWRSVKRAHTVGDPHGYEHHAARLDAALSSPDSKGMTK